MMTKFWMLGILSIASLACNAVSNENLVVIASPLAIESTSESYVSLVKPGAITVGYGNALKLRYSIDDILYGHSESGEIVFYDRALVGGFPEYVTNGNLYIFLVKIGENYILSNTGTIIGEEDDIFICGSRLNPYAEDNTLNSPKYQRIHACEQAVEQEKLRGYFEKFNFNEHGYKINNLLKQ